jgi:hypothetical protein
VNDIGEDGKLLSLLYLVTGPLVGRFVARLLPGHALGDPLFAAAQFAPILPGPLQRQSRIGDLPQPFIAHLRKPTLERLRLGGRDGLNQPENSRDVPALESLNSPLRFKGERKGGTNCPPL